MIDHRMYLMYVDESGDTGLINSPSPIFVLAGIVVHELRWRETLDAWVAFRKRMRETTGLKLREELHAAGMISQGPGELARIPKHERLGIIRRFASEIGSTPDISCIHVLVKKQGKPAEYDVFEKAWLALIQRFEDTMSHKNFPGPANPDERGMIICDQTDARLKNLLRKMRHFNPIPHRRDLYGGGYRNLTLRRVIEDPSHRDSRDSFFIQAADLMAYLLYQQENPNKYVKRKGGQNYFSFARDVFCRHASPGDPQGVKRL